MSRTIRYEAKFVTTFPSPMDRGLLYVATGFSLAGHICPCGCGNEVVTKLSPARYKVVFDGEISLSPSVAATGLACNSHYFITRGEVDWHPKLTPKQVERVQVRDRRAVQESRSEHSVSLWRRLRRSVLGGRRSG